MHNSQEVAKKIKDLLKNKNTTAKEMLTACGLSVNTLSSMQSGGYYPRLEAISKIAEYLNCSVDYLLGRTAFAFPPEVEKKNNAIVDIVLRLRSDNNFLTVVQNINSLTPEQLSAVETFLSAFSKTEDN